jgi:subtilase family serine protease
MHTFSKIGPKLNTTFAQMRPDNFAGKYGPYITLDLKQAYEFPSDEETNGSGVTIGIVIDSPVSQADIDEYFKLEGSKIAPNVVDDKIDGGGTYGGDGTGEATLDVQQSAGIAPGAGVTMYDIPELSDQDIYDAYSAVAKNDDVQVVNSSFGGCELAFNSASGKKALNSFDAVFKQGLSEGITWVAASGDQAAMVCGTKWNARGVSWPAVSVYVLGVGGTNLTTSFRKKSYNSTYVHEDEYADIKPSNGADYWGSGGGYSKLYKRPTWQKGFVSNAGRGVPDVAVHMGGEGFSSAGKTCDAQKCNLDDSSDFEYVEGNLTNAIGTSAASPDFVGLLALTMSLIHKQLGFVNQQSYVLARQHPGYYFRHGLEGFNGYKTTKTLWDPVLGLGTPFGARLAGAKKLAGVPGSASNP